MLAYLDTNVFDHLFKKENGVTDADELQLRATISSGRLTIVVSHINIREILAALHAKPEIVGPELSLVASLTNWDYFVRFHSAILEDDIKHFAYNGERSNTPFEDERTVARIRAAVRRVIDDPLSVKGLAGVVREDREQKKAFLDAVKKSRGDTAEGLEEIRKRNEIPPFERYFANSAQEFALALARSFGVAEGCERRGLNNLLKIPSVRAMTAAGMSFIYRTAVEKKSPKGSDSRDLHHAVCAAAAADIFVTHDDELAILLDRIPSKGFRVMRLHQLLKETNHKP